jgi:hypothetical protein
MANQNIPNDPYDPYRSGLSDEVGRPSRFDSELQADPELDEGPASSGKIALFALGIALVLGAVFYGLNNTSVHEAQTAPPKSIAQSQPTSPQAPPGMRDVTPRPNTEPGTTTGAAPSNPSPPQSSPQGMDKQ